MNGPKAFRRLVIISRVAVLGSIFIGIPLSAFADPLAGTVVYLDKVNWNGSVHHAPGTPAKVGGWARGPTISYSYEAALKFDLSAVSGALQFAKLRFHVTGGVTGVNSTVTAFDVNQGSWSPSTVTYDTFCAGQTGCVSWNAPLGNVDVNASQPGWYEIEGAALLTKVQQWVESPSSNNGLVLSGNFYTHEYFVDVDQVELLVNTQLPSGDPYLDWPRRAPIVLNTSASGANLTGAVQNFPLLLRLDAQNFNFDEAKDDGRDRPLEFTYEDGLGHHKDVMRYDEAGNRITKISLLKPGQTPLDQILVDGEASQERDYPQLVEALVDIGGRIGGMTQDPGEVAIHAVPGASGEVDLNGINEITAFSFQGGEKEFDLVGTSPGTEEYASLLAVRTQDYALEKSTHYTGLGSEIREEPDTIPGRFTKKFLLDMPQGLGRYSVNTPEGLYYLKNHLGTTVATALMGATGSEDVYDYFPYGLQEKLVTTGQDKVTPTFTGKELDEGLGLYYFGARFLDPELGLWISPDPAREFHSPYTYVGNNPINYSDPDGRSMGDKFLTPWQLGLNKTYDASVLGMQEREVEAAFISLNGGNAAALSERLNAFRHAYITFVLARAFGVSEAAMMLKNHEIGRIWEKGFFQRDDVDSEIDIENNIKVLELLTSDDFTDWDPYEFASQLESSGRLINKRDGIKGDPDPSRMDRFIQPDDW